VSLSLVLGRLSPHREKGIPNYNYKKGKLTFVKAKLLRPEPEEPMVCEGGGGEEGGKRRGGGEEGGKRRKGDKLGEAAATFHCFLHRKRQYWGLWLFQERENSYESRRKRNQHKVHE